MKRIVIIIFLFISYTGMTQEASLQVIASAGGYFENETAGFSLSWTVGEVAYSTLTATDYILTQGFQQGDLFATNTEEPNFSESGISIYPNPAVNEIRVIISAAEGQESVLVDFYDLTGRKVDSRKFQFSPNVPKTLELSTLKPGLYLVKFTFENANRSTLIKLVKK